MHRRRVDTSLSDQTSSKGSGRSAFDELNTLLGEPCAVARAGNVLVLATPSHCPKSLGLAAASTGPSIQGV